MKRMIGTTFLLFLFGTAWWNRYPLFFLFSHYRHRPPAVHLSETNAHGWHVYYVPGLKTRSEDLSRRLAENISGAQKELGVNLPADTKIYLYTNWKEKGDQIEDIRIASADVEEHTIHCIVNERYDGLRERVEYELLLAAKLGNPAQKEWSRISAAALGGVWNQKSLAEWSSFLRARNLDPQFPAFFTGQQHFSDFVTYPWNALFARFVKDRFGWDAFAELYRELKPPSGYEAAWREYCAGLPSTPPPRALAFKPEFQKGVSYAYANGYEGGYATAKSRQSLDELQRIRVRWVAAIPYGFMRAPSAGQIHFAGNTIGSESDESMFALADDARKRGLKIMLKPQLWIGQMAWTGQVDFSGNPEWQQWFDSYKQWILHYAIIAELMKADIFCIGTELVQTTLKRPQDWKALIRAIRDVYHGPLVYASNYGSEFEGITFWDSLDYIGLDNYYPVRSSTEDGTDEMKRRFAEQKEKVKSIALRFQKPLIFTETGYQAMDGAGMGSRESNFPEYNEEKQAVCYRLLMETYWNENWFYGMYWWKWFSDPEDRGKEADPHSPHGRMAERTLEEFYQKER